MGRLSRVERNELWDLWEAGESQRSISRQLGRSPSTVRTRLVSAGWRRPTPPADWCSWHLSLSEREEISRWLVRAYPDDEETRVSHETIYQSLFVQGRGALRKELWRSLRTGRAVRRPQGRAASTKGQIRDMVMISERPAEIEDRAVPGHWEGDLIIGTGNSAIGTLVERHTRYVMLFQVPKGNKAEDARVAVTETIKNLPEHLWQSLTWDQGKEMAQHATEPVRVSHVRC